MAEDVKVTFSADTSGLDAAIAKLKANMQQLDPALVELGGKITAAFKKIGLDPGKAFGTMDPNDRQALIQYGASLQTVGTAAQSAAAKIQMVGQAVQQTGAKTQMLNALMASAAGGGVGGGGLPPGGIYGGLPGGGGGLRPPVTTAVPGLAYVAPQAQQATVALQQFGNASRQAGIDFGSMLERMAFRMAIFEALRLVIQGIKYAFDQISNLQQAQLQFDAMSDAADHLSGRFQFLKEQASTAIIPIEKAVQVRNTLQDYGASADQAAIYVKDLGQWSQILGVDADKLAQSLGRVAEGEGSLQDMRLVTRMMGEQGEAGRALVQNLVELEKAQKRLETESAAVEKSMATQLRTTEQLGAAIDRSRSRGQEFLQQTGILKDIQAQLPRLARMPEGVTPEFLQATGQLKLPQLPPGTSQIVRNQTKDYIAQYKEGLAEIQKEEGLTSMAMRALAPTLPTDYVMRKAKEAHEDQMRNLREEDEATRAIMEGRKTEAGLAVTGAKAQLAAALPQAVTAPPPALWAGFADSLKGQGLQTKQDFDNGIQRVVDALVNVQTSADGTTAAVGGLENLFRGG